MALSTVVDIILLIMSVMLVNFGPDDAGKQPHVDVIGPDGFAMTLVMSEKPDEVLEVYTLEGEERTLLMSMYPPAKDDETTIRIEHADGTKSTFDLAVLMEIGPQFQDLREDGPPVDVTVGDATVRVALRGRVLYCSRDGQTYVTRLGGEEADSATEPGMEAPTAPYEEERRREGGSPAVPEEPR